MKRLTLLILIACLLTLLCASALAEPRYPESGGVVTDAAAVLSASTVEDLRAFSDRLRKEADMPLRVATVDFLDGASLTDYGETLRDRWDMDDEELLLLLSVGEDRFAFFPGEDVELSSAVLGKLLSAHLEAPFLRQDYDGAIRALMPALCDEVNKAYRCQASTAGLFGQAESRQASWADRLAEEATAAPSMRQVVTEEDRSTGFSLGKVILTVLLLMVIFGNDKKHRRNGCGCGCMPFSSLLAGLGLWKLWGRRD